VSVQSETLLSSYLINYPFFSYAVPDVPYAIDGTVTTAELNTFVNALLRQKDGSSETDFDFLVFDEYLRGRLCDHLREKAISFEDAIEIEYVERFPAPEPQDCLLHDDWVSAVKASGKWILSGCYDNTLNLWTNKGKHILTIPGHTAPIKAVDWISLDEETGRFVSTSQDQTAMLWQWSVASNSVECVSVCKGHERGVDSVSVSPDGQRFATGSWDTMLKVWSAEVDDAAEGTSKRMKESGVRVGIHLCFKMYLYRLTYCFADPQNDVAGTSREHFRCAMDGCHHSANWQLGSHTQGVGSEPRGH